MKISDLINQLEKLKERHGDNEVNFLVTDFYGREKLAIAHNRPNIDQFWEGTITSEGTTNIKIKLENDLDGKKPLITFKK